MTSSHTVALRPAIKQSLFLLISWEIETFEAEAHRVLAGDLHGYFQTVPAAVRHLRSAPAGRPDVPHQNSRSVA